LPGGTLKVFRTSFRQREMREKKAKELDDLKGARITVSGGKGFLGSHPPGGALSSPMI
jgi:hypothetical protein